MRDVLLASILTAISMLVVLGWTKSPVIGGSSHSSAKELNTMEKLNSIDELDFYGEDEFSPDESLPALPSVNYRSIPMPAQTSIDIAMKRYNIKAPKGITGPFLNPLLADRGLTTFRISGPTMVEIGPAAFSSWSLLGSTLAHEIEVHAGRTLMGIRVEMVLGLTSEADLEREAYLYEINNANRFGLSKEEISSIKYTMRNYFPEKDQN